MAARRSRGEALVDEAPGILEGQQTCDKKYLSMLHKHLRGYVSHIAEDTALPRGIVNKPFLVTLNETFLTKVIENVQLEG